jgi:hypothetical protein
VGPGVGEDGGEDRGECVAAPGRTFEVKELGFDLT